MLWCFSKCIEDITQGDISLSNLESVSFGKKVDENVLVSVKDYTDITKIHVKLFIEINLH